MDTKSAEKHIKKKQKKHKKQFLYNPKNPKKSFDVYIDKNPKDTIHIKYPSAKNVRQRFELANKYFKFLSKRTKQPTFQKRKQMTFKF